MTENGSVEGSEDDVVRCEVESFLSLPVRAFGRERREPAVAAERSSGNRFSTCDGGGIDGPR